jgi:catechol 2,3-dioxygenase-like lactoylglutathione lyase family enzyme
MSVQLDHTIVPARDKHESAQFLSEILGVAEPVAMGHFVAVAIDHGLTLDFADSEEPIRPIHFAFRVTEAEFDEVFGRVTDRGLPYWADPRRSRPGEVAQRGAGRGFYFEDPSGHYLEVLTRGDA